MAYKTVIQDIPALDSQLEPQCGHCISSAIYSLHRRTPCYEHDLGVNFYLTTARLLVMRMPF